MDGRAIARIVDSELASRGMSKAQFYELSRGRKQSLSTSFLCFYELLRAIHTLVSRSVVILWLNITQNKGYVSHNFADKLLTFYVN